MRRQSRSWLWLIYFVVLAVLATVGVTLPIVYNLGQQLKPERLAQAKQLWLEKGPRDYDLTYSITYDKQRLAERHVVQVRGGAVAFEACEGEIVRLPPALGALAGLPLGGSAEGGPRDVNAIFAHIGALLDEENTAERRNFIVAVFDPKEGYPRRFIRRIRGTRTREEWDIRLFAAGALSGKEPPWKAKRE